MQQQRADGVLMAIDQHGEGAPIIVSDDEGDQALVRRFQWASPR
jgi:hypothetical protein